MHVTVRSIDRPEHSSTSGGLAALDLGRATAPRLVGSAINVNVLDERICALADIERAAGIGREGTTSVIASARSK